jgi:hypothetical protein
MAHPSFNNIGAYIATLRACSATAIAGGAGDNTETNGPTVDRQQGSPGLGMTKSAVLQVAVVATLAASKKCTVKATIQHDSDSAFGSPVDVPAALQPNGAADSVIVTLTDGGAGGTQSGFFEHSLNLLSLNRYIRAQVHIDLDAGATDIGAYGASWALGGGEQLPA